MNKLGITTACTHKRCPPETCLRTERLIEGLERIEKASSPKPKPELDDAIGTLSKGRFIERQVQLRRQIHGLSPEMIAIVAELARNSDNDFCRLAAANSLLDRDLGRAVQFTEHTLKEERVINVQALTPEMREQMVHVLDALDPQRKISE